MLVLVVNAYKDNPEGKKAFYKFFQALKKAFKQQRYFNKEDIKFTCVDHNTIDEYLFEQYTEFVDTAAEKKFDYLDFVFIDGDANLLPWHPKAYKFLILLRMCKRTEKVLFAAGCGMLIQVYLCANKYHVNRVINGKGKGTALKKIYEISSEELGELEPGDVFLDSGTGDMYCYDLTASEFIPIVNVGFHNKKAAEDMENRQYILKSYKYQPRTSEFSEPVNPGKHSETVCRVLKQCMQHWLVKDLGLKEFLVSQKNFWDIHAINVADINSKFTILAESSRSPQIIYMHNTSAILFNIDPTYPESLKVLENFVNHMLLEYQTNQKLDKPLSAVPYSVMSIKPFLRNQPSSSRPITASTAKLDTSVYPGQDLYLTATRLRPTSSHSGFAISKRKHEPVVVPNNATRQETIHVQPAKVQTSSESLSLPLGKTVGINIRGTFDRNSTIYMLRQQIGCGNTSCAEEYISKKFCDSGRMTSRSNDTGHQNELYKILATQEPIYEKPKIKTWGKKEIRSMLHGNENNISTEQSVRKQKVRIVYKSKYETSRVKSNTEDMYTTLNQKTKSLKYPFPGSVTSGDVYIEPSKISIRPASGQSKWVSCERFNVVTKKNDEKTQLALASEPYNPVSAHKFRAEDKSKWIQGSFKVV